MTFHNIKQVHDDSTPPWMEWRGTRPGLIQRFITTYCLIPKGYGAGKPMVLAPFQEDAIEQLFSDGVRTGELSMARGNGKSSLIAAIALAHLCLEPDSPQVPLIATKLVQIERATYGVAMAMVKRHPEIKNRSLIYQAIGNRAIKTPWNQGEMFPISATPEGLVGLDPSLALCDEAGFISVESWEALKQASGKRPESLVLGLGTTGETDSALYSLHLLHEGGQVVPGHVRINYSAPKGCNWQDESQWPSANPALAQGFLDIEVLRNEVISSSEESFRRFRLNQWVEIAGQSWLGDNAMTLWMRNADMGYQWDPSVPAFGGVDVSMYSDSSAVIRVQQKPDGKWHSKSRVFWPDGSGVIPFDEIRETIRAIPNLSICAYDNRFFGESAQILSQEGILMLDVPQTAPRMVPAYSKMHRMIVDGSLTHDGAPDYASQVCSAVAAHTDFGFTLSKNKTGKKKIDSAVATALALSVTGTEPELDEDSLTIY